MVQTCSNTFFLLFHWDSGILSRFSGAGFRLSTVDPGSVLAVNMFQPTLTHSGLWQIVPQEVKTLRSVFASMVISCVVDICTTSWHASYGVGRKWMQTKHG